MVCVPTECVHHRRGWLLRVDDRSTPVDTAPVLVGKFAHTAAATAAVPWCMRVRVRVHVRVRVRVRARVCVCVRVQDVRFNQLRSLPTTIGRHRKLRTLLLQGNSLVRRQRVAA